MRTFQIRRLFRTLILSALMFICMSFLCAASAGGLDIHFMDIGRNDGIVIVCDGEAAFIDAGFPERAQQAVNYMQGLNINHLKYYIGTHAHKDHVGGASVIINALKVDSVLQSHDAVKNRIVECAPADHRPALDRTPFINAQVGQTYYVGSAALTVIGPTSIKNVYPGSTDENVNSLVLRVTYGSTSFVLTGDATRGSLRTIDPSLLHCDVYKNAHHNANLAADVLELVRPKYMVYSTVADQLPAASVLKSVVNIGAMPLITSSNRHGTIVFHSDGQNLTYTTVYQPESISFKVSEVNIYAGKTATVSASAKPTYFNSMILYTSDDPAIARVEANGKITGVSQGTTVIHAVLSNGVTADCTVTVKPADITLNKSAVSIVSGKTASLSGKITPSGKLTITWTSDDPAIASVSAKGKITAGQVGETVIRATLPGGQSAACTVTVLPVDVRSVSIKPSSVKTTIGYQVQLTGSVSPKNATYPALTWSSADESIAKIDQNGLLTAVGVGKTKVTATASNGRAKTISVTVKPVYVQSISVSAPTTQLVCGVPGKNTVQLSAAILPIDATIPDVTWKSGNSRIATVDENGFVTATGTGKVTIYATATDGSRRRGTLRIVVAENKFVRAKALSEPEKITFSAKQMRYVRNQFEIVMFCSNMTGDRIPLPMAGTLALVLPDQTKLPLTVLAPGRSTLRAGGTGTFTVRLPMAEYPQLNGIDLSLCDAVLIPSNNPQ